MPRRLINKRPPKRLADIIRKPTTLGFIKVYVDEPDARFDEVGEMVKRGVLKWIGFRTDEGIGYHYYKKVIKKVTKTATKKITKKK